MKCVGGISTRGVGLGVFSVPPAEFFGISEAKTTIKQVFEYG
jgi:hypothetical protein